MEAPGLLFLALYEKVSSLVGADVVTDIKIDCVAQVSQVISRAFLFVLNLLIARQLAEEDFALYVIQFHLLVTTILFISREGIRHPCLRSDVRDCMLSRTFGRAPVHYCSKFASSGTTCQDRGNSNLCSVYNYLHYDCKWNRKGRGSPVILTNNCCTLVWSSPSSHFKSWSFKKERNLFFFSLIHFTIEVYMA
jgi:hypothetical protein